MPYNPFELSQFNRFLHKQNKVPLDIEQPENFHAGARKNSVDSEGVVYENWEQRAHDTETNLETIFPDIAASHIEHENKSCNDIQAGEPNEEFFNFAEIDDPLLACSPNSDEKNFFGDSKNSESLKLNIRSDSNSERFRANF